MVSGGSTRVDAGYAGPELGVDVDHQFQDQGAIDLGDFQIFSDSLSIIHVLLDSLDSSWVVSKRVKYVHVPS